MAKLELLAGQKQKGESQKAILACNDFLRLGAGRKQVVLIRKYAEMQESSPPTRSRATLSRWSSDFDWPARSVDYDVAIDEEKTAYAQHMLREGLALDYERVAELKDLFALLSKQLLEEGEDGELHNLWLPDIKTVGSGKDAERVDIERYNSPLISDIRGLLDDLAKETGGRTKGIDITSAGSVLKAYIGVNPDDWDE